MRKRILALSIALALMAVIALPMNSFAATTDTTTISGSMSDTISVDAPDGFSMTLDPAASQPITSAAKTVAVNASGIKTWNLKVHEQDGDGKMSSGSDTLNYAMVLNATGGVGDIALSNAGTPTNIVSNHSAGSTNIDVVFKQRVEYTDTPHTDYSITVTFTVEFTS